MAIFPTRPDVLLHSEGLVALAVECTAYQHFYAGHWGWFALLFLAPDVSLLGYLRPPSRAAAAFYNLIHCYVLPLALGLLAWGRGPALAGQMALIWLAHISFDRAMGYGLKFPQAFRPTHLQRAASIADKTLQ